MIVTHKKLLFVNSLKASGIGDFGLALFSEIDDSETDKHYIETRPSLRSLISNWSKIVTFKGNVIVNLGFTSYGRSPSLNFANILLIKLSHSILKRKIQVILHDSPDLTNQETSGYKNYYFLKKGGGIATKLIRKLKVHVFSITLYGILKDNYQFENVEYYPFPCFSTSKFGPLKENAKFCAINIGYLAPYKGLELFEPLKIEMPKTEFIIGGTPHPILSKTKKGGEYFYSLIRKLAEAGVQIRGFMTEEEIKELTKNNRVIGILPYLSTSGSSYAATYFMERDIPVLAADLKEFRALFEFGAGIVLSNRDVKEFADYITKFENNLDFYHSLVVKNQQYCSNYSVKNFLSKLEI